MKNIKSVLLGALILSWCSSVSAQSVSSLQNEIAALREDVLSLQRQNYRENAENPQKSSDVQVRLGQLEEQMRSLNGKVEELEYKIKTFDDKVAMINKDIDTRFQLLEGKAVTSTSSDLAVTPKFNAPKAENAPKSVTGDVVQGSELEPIGSKEVAEIYQNGLNALKANNYTTAEQNFSKIVNQNPNDRLAGNAQYWLGEVYYAQQDFAKAAVAFAKGYQNYKNGAKGPDSLFKLGMSMKSMKKNTEACAAFTSMKTEFPKANADILSRAADEAKKLKCK
ncbi:MAG: tol-pal system protein YbgF [Alphaproteobacteria bacterium]|nr:tol-pal system protein YbgF [Alphaproteobacteria bacterium]